MTKSSFFSTLLFAVSTILFVSCDKDFNELGSDIVGDGVHHDLIRQEIDVTAYNRGTGPVQANNLPLNQLGVYNNPVFGKTVSHFVTQLAFATNNENPTFFEPVVDTVYLYVPYYSTATGNETVSGETRTTYELDSIYGNKTATFKLEVYENGYFLRDSDPSSADGMQKYFSDEMTMVDNAKIGAPINNSEDPKENTQFSFSPVEIIRKLQRTDGTFKELERKTPGIYLQLNKDFITQKIFNTSSANRLNNNVFKNYFRGLYFKVTQNGNESVMAMPRFSEGNIVIKYTDFEINIDGTKGTDRITKTLTLNLSGNTINFFENSYNDEFTSAIASSDALSGDEKLYVKGGAGSMAIMKIDDTALTAIKYGPPVLINEANLVFYVDKSKVNSVFGVEPFRLYLYDLKNKTPLLDYYSDATSSNSLPKYNKAVHGGIRTVDSDGNTIYKIRITDHINNILKKDLDSTNVRLGLVVSESINQISNARIKTPFYEGIPGTEDAVTIDRVPVSSVVHPFGTVLYGSKIGEGEADRNKRVKLEIFYSKPN